VKCSNSHAGASRGSFALTLLIALTFVLSPTFAKSQNVPTATIITNQGLTHNLLRQLLPLPGSVPSANGPIHYWFADFYFCGAPAAGTKAILLGVIRDGPPPNSQPLPILGSGDCNGFGSLKLKSLDVSALAVQMTLEWVNWDLTLSVTNATVYPVGRPAPGLSAVGSLLLALNAPLASFTTRGISVPIAGAQSVNLDASVYFGVNATKTTLYRANTQPVSPTGQLDPGSLPTPANCSIEVAYSLANAISTLDLPQSSIPLDNVGNKQLELDHLSFSGAVDQLTVQGTLRQAGGSPLSFPVSIQWTGQDLGVSKISIQVNPQSCSSSDLACNVTNNVLTNLAPQIQNHYQTLYGGALLRPTSYNDPAKLTLLGTPILLRMRTIKAQATDHSVTVEDIVGVEKQ
jgi:hypothetical protein